MNNIMTDTWKDFPGQEVIGRRFKAEETGLTYEGEIVDIVREDNFILFCHDAPIGENSFSCATKYGSWWRTEDGIIISIPMVGRFTIYT